MPEEIKRKRGRPPKQETEKILETNTQSTNSYNQTYEYSSYIANSLVDAVFSCGIYDYFSKQDIENILRDPITYHDEAIRLSNFVYTKNGIVANSIDYMASLPCLDKVITNKNKKQTNKVKTNKDLMNSTLKVIDDKTFIRNALFTEMLDGTAFFLVSK